MVNNAGVMPLETRGTEGRRHPSAVHAVLGNAAIYQYSPHTSAYRMMKPGAVPQVSRMI